VQKLEVELAQVEREQKRLKKQLEALDRQKAELVAELAGMKRSGAPEEEQRR